MASALVNSVIGTSDEDAHDDPQHDQTQSGHRRLQVAGLTLGLGLELQLPV